MPLAVGDLELEFKRRFRVIDAGLELGKRQAPGSPSAPVEPTPTPQPTSAEISTTSPSTTVAPSSTSTTATTTFAAPTSPTSVTTSTTSSVPDGTTTSATSTVPTDPAQSSAVASQSSASTTSAISTQSVTSTQNNPGSAEMSTRFFTSVFTTNGAGQSVVTVVVTSNTPAPSASASNSGSTNTGAVVGGVVGGVGGLILLILLLWFIRRKTKKDKFEENMFAPDRNVDRGELDLAGDDVHDPEAVARPYHLPPSPTRNEMAMSANSRPLSAHLGPNQDRPLSGPYDEAAVAAMSGPTSEMSYYTQPAPGVGMPMPIPMSLDHIAHTQSQATSAYDHTQPSETTMSEGGSSSARMLKEREARRLHVANDNGGVIVHSDGGRVDEEPEEEIPQEIPPTYDSIGGPSGAR